MLAGTVQRQVMPMLAALNIFTLTEFDAWAKGVIPSRIYPLFSLEIAH